MRHVEDVTYEARSMTNDDAPHLSPCIYSQTELARDVSNLLEIHDGKWLWKLVAYVVSWLNSRL